MSVNLNSYYLDAVCNVSKRCRWNRRQCTPRSVWSGFNYLEFYCPHMGHTDNSRFKSGKVKSVTISSTINIKIKREATLSFSLFPPFLIGSSFKGKQLL